MPTYTLVERKRNNDLSKNVSGKIFIKKLSIAEA